VTARDPQRTSRGEGLRLLDESASLVARGWCQGVLAVDDDGRRVEPWSRSARRWSPLGALLRTWYESPNADADAFRIAYAALAGATGGRLEEWNAARWRTRRHVLNAFGRARIYVPSGPPSPRVTADPPERARSADPDHALVFRTPAESQ
jgi:hypothetical protein